MTARNTLALAVAILLLSAAGLAAQPLVQKMLPGSNAIRGFEVTPKSLVYGKGDDIVKIYNGGYELYTENGVVDAVRQMYQRNRDYVEVTVHTMKSEKAAMDFLKYWQKEHRMPRLTTTRNSSGFTVTKPNVIVYRVTGKYFTTVSAFYSSETAAADAGRFAAFVEQQVLKLDKPAKAR